MTWNPNCVSTTSEIPPAGSPSAASTNTGSNCDRNCDSGYEPRLPPLSADWGSIERAEIGERQAVLGQARLDLVRPAEALLQLFDGVVHRAVLHGDVVGRGVLLHHLLLDLVRQREPRARSVGALTVDRRSARRAGKTRQEAEQHHVGPNAFVRYRSVAHDCR